MSKNEYKMNENEDKMLDRFFSEQKREIQDNGFSKRVMRKLPVQERRFVEIWTAICATAIMIVFFVFNGWQQVWRLFSEILHAPAWKSLESVDPGIWMITFLLTGSFVLYEVCLRD